ncbi:MAG: SDR family oxidoreductase [Gemmatimonadota bacterium]
MPGKKHAKRRQRPPQTQRRQPGLESRMTPRPQADDPSRRGSSRLAGKVALITGGDSGIGRAVAIAFAREGADVAIAYLDEHDDAKETARMVADEGREAVLISGDIGSEPFCRRAVKRTITALGRLDILVNNAAEQHRRETLDDIEAKSLERVFRTNLFSHIYLAKAALPHLAPGSAIINTASVTAYRGSPHLPDYAATKGAIVALTRSLAGLLADKGIRVNGVAPGPVWTPLIPASFPAKEVATFGSDVALGRAGEPAEIAPCYVFLASEDASYMTGQFLHPNGGEIVNA